MSCIGRQVISARAASELPSTAPAASKEEVGRRRPLVVGAGACAVAVRTLHPAASAERSVYSCHRPPAQRRDRVRRAEVDQGVRPGSPPPRGHAYPSHTTSAATSIMTVSANRSRSHEFMPQNGRTEGDNSRYLGHGSVVVRFVAARIHSPRHRRSRKLHAPETTGIPTLGSPSAMTSRSAVTRDIPAKAVSAPIRCHSLVSPFASRVWHEID